VLKSHNPDNVGEEFANIAHDFKRTGPLRTSRPVSLAVNGHMARAVFRAHIRATNGNDCPATGALILMADYTIHG